MAAQVAVLIPGIMGSVLKLGDEMIWPGSVSELLLPYGKMKQLMLPNLEPTDLIRTVSISNQYLDLIASLNVCGFIEEPKPPTLFVCPYDWRKANEEAAGRLASVIEKADAQHHGDLEISLIGHSMGGLVSRFYLESGDFANRAGFQKVKRLITLGTPHRGAPLALAAAMGMESRLFLNAEQVQQIASSPLYPSVYQLLPPEDEPFAWDDDPDSRFTPMQIYDPATSRGLKLVPQNVASAQAFHSKLDLAKKPKSIDYFFFYGTHQTTISTVYLRKVGREYRARKLELENAGDGTVPVWSGMQSRIQGLPVGGEHGSIYKNGELKSTLATLLGKKGVLAALAPPPELAIRDRVVLPEGKVNAVAIFPGGIPSLRAELKLTRVVDEKGKTAARPYETKEAIVYSGAPIDRISFVFTAPPHVGIYRVEFLAEGKAAASDDLFVQKPQL